MDAAQEPHHGGETQDVGDYGDAQPDALNASFVLAHILKPRATIHSLPNELLSEIFALAAREAFKTQVLACTYAELSLIVADNLKPILATW
ncbi:hypothetical protein BD309DRAFT_1017250 [Dichomitus squalens]|uniref:Uncharacterized protein n=1 Tax=Dichomitus squalens TaxID=114155 RepID=A0A4V2K7S9_9APHY|nr:hypothetical protein BD309DRAFT_1017250 [Dichomitus squalens]TBU57328.1 hypothetical protein BD310DRAFT_978170 [Dichomitus squalens]